MAAVSRFVMKPGSIEKLWGTSEMEAMLARLGSRVLSRASSLAEGDFGMDTGRATHGRMVARVYNAADGAYLTEFGGPNNEKERPLGRALDTIQGVAR